MQSKPFYGSSSVPYTEKSYSFTFYLTPVVRIPNKRLARISAGSSYHEREDLVPLPVPFPATVEYQRPQGS